ncbi:hypothetical protein [uncultured Roseovarius sp.]|uniref:hypothetical protein n=1 Tax=uncultured Roseovarius sp. TaxID=293344 RepID=UPI002612E0E9|nr:hypothetical protein [uncultured Roseovarius sp.]
MPQEYFVPMKMKKVKGGTKLHGQFIVDGDVTISNSSSDDDDDKPVLNFDPRDLFFEVKWIAWPGSPSAAFGASMGYEVVSPDDFSYPPPRK